MERRQHSQSPGAEVTQSSEAAPQITTTKLVYEQLRSDILYAKLEPGVKLRAEVLRKRFQVGSSPIREALNRLLIEGFVTLEEQKGFKVAPISLDDLRELFAARIWIDTTAITASIASKNVEWEEALVLAFHRLSRISQSYGVSAHRHPEWEKLHRAFHLALIASCGSGWMIRISEQLFDAAERYRRIGAPQMRERNELGEHRAIFQACLDRKTQEAMQLLQTHYQETCRTIAQSLTSASSAQAS
jgi:GntR family carbon starvation induced transcriptional regulator